MVCPNCGTSNSEGSKFCMSCGRELLEMSISTQCPNCGTTNAAGSKYCMGCGHDLATKIVSPLDQSLALAPPATIAAPVQAKSIHARPGKLLDLGDVLLALIGTGLGALACLISQALLSQVSYPLPTFALSAAGLILTLLVSFLGIIPLTIMVFRSRAIARKTKLKMHFRKESGFFMTVDEDISFLLGQAEKKYAE